MVLFFSSFVSPLVDSASLAYCESVVAGIKGACPAPFSLG